jgi:hypothetical protein
MTFRPSVQFSWMNLYCEFYDPQQGLEIWALNLVVIPMCTNGFEPPMTEDRQYFCIKKKKKKQMYKTVFGYNRVWLHITSLEIG